MVTGIDGLAAENYSAIEIQSIKTAQAEFRDRVQNHKEDYTRNTKK